MNTRKKSIYDEPLSRGADWLPASKTKVFKKLFDEIKDQAGGYRKARELIGIGGSVVDDMNKGKKISTVTARKILDAHAEHARRVLG